MTVRKITYTDLSGVAAQRARQGFVPVEEYASRVPEPQEIGSIVENGVTTEHVFVRRMRLYPGVGAPSDYFNGA